MIQHTQNKTLLYINGELSDKEKTIFEQELFKSESLQKLYSEIKQSDDLIRKSTIIKKAPDFRKPSSANYKFLSMAAGILSLIVVSLFTLQNNQQEEFTFEWEDNDLNTMLVIQMEMNSQFIFDTQLGIDPNFNQTFDKNMLEIETALHQIQKNN